MENKLIWSAIYRKYLKICAEIDSEFSEDQKRKKLNSLCFFSSVIVEASVTVYPNMVKSKRCTFMLLSNLAEPEWISVHCRQKLHVTAVLCETQSLAFLKNYHKEGKANYCPHLHFSVGRKCLLFLWYQNDSTQSFHSNGFCEQKSRHHASLSGVKQFQYVFDATSVQLPPLLFSDFSDHTTAHTVKYIRYLNIFEFKHDVTDVGVAKGFRVCVSDEGDFSLHGNTFKCKNGAYVSHNYLCDGSIDCLYDDSDELNCFNLNMTNPSHSQDGQERSCKKGETCSELCYFSVKLLCNLFHVQDQKKQSFPADREFMMCKNGVELNVLLKDDLVADCGSDGEDELVLLSLLRHHKYVFCTLPHQIPCKQGHSKCFVIADICTFTLDVFGNLHPCRNGGHIEQCNDFQCNMMFKCPNSFSVPWQYANDGKWDCPFGNEEALHLTCVHMYKCRNTVQCVHLGTVCDGSENCPSGDDEHSCELMAVQCPSPCQCILFGMRCGHVTNVNSILSQTIFPHVSLYVSYSNVVSVGMIVQKFPGLIFAVFIHSCINDICHILYPGFVIHFDVSYNLVAKLQNNCLFSLWKTKILNLKDNHISLIEDQSFRNLTALQFLSLSNNPLGNLPEKFIFDSLSVRLVSMRNISLQHFDTDAFQAATSLMVDVTDYHLCCIAPSRINCTSEIPWYFSCSDLLPETAMRVIFILVSVFILVLNISSLAVHLMMPQKAYLCVVVSANMTETLFLLYLCFLWGADIYFEGEFLLEEELWRTSSGCFAAFDIVLWFTLLSPFVLMFLSLSRLMIVIHPLNTKFKRTKFAITCVSSVTSASFSLSLAVTLIVNFTSKLLPTPLCLPFIDPSDTVILIKIITWSVAVTQFGASITMIILHILLVYKKFQAQKNIRKSKQDDTSSSMIIQLVIINTSNILCWLPANAVYLAAIFLSRYPTSLIIWTTASVSPVNSIINPVVFLVTAIRKYGVTQS